jgi:hypothetical protein
MNRADPTPAEHPQTVEGRECAWCGFAGNAPDDWWHVHRGTDPAGRLEAREEPITLCDLCYETGRGYSHTLEIVNGAANRILAALREATR